MGGTGVKRVGLPYQTRAPIALGTSENRRREAVWDKFRVARYPTRTAGKRRTTR
jgi:hypothetical protein